MRWLWEVDSSSYILKLLTYYGEIKITKTKKSLSYCNTKVQKLNFATMQILLVTKLLMAY